MLEIGITKSPSQDEFQNIINSFNESIGDASQKKVEDFGSPAL